MGRPRSPAPLGLFLTFAACAAPAAPDWSAVRSELGMRVRTDQELRQRLALGGEIDLALAQRLKACDRENTAWIRTIVERGGWPTIARVGEQGSSDAWLLVQHADHDVDFQEHCLALLREAVVERQALPKHLAYLEDRVALHRRRPQRYGTQFVAGEDGLVPYTLEDPTRVDAWRAQVGLGPLEEYATRLRGGR